MKFTITNREALTQESSSSSSAANVRSYWASTWQTYRPVTSHLMTGGGRFPQIVDPFPSPLLSLHFSFLTSLIPSPSLSFPPFFTFPPLPSSFLPFLFSLLSPSRRVPVPFLLSLYSLSPYLTYPSLTSHYKKISGHFLIILNNRPTSGLNNYICILIGTCIKHLWVQLITKTMLLHCINKIITLKILFIILKTTKNDHLISIGESFRKDWNKK